MNKLGNEMYRKIKPQPAKKNEQLSSKENAPTGVDGQ